jgi:hypothetical protein
MACRPLLLVTENPPWGDYIIKERQRQLMVIDLYKNDRGFATGHLVECPDFYHEWHECFSINLNGIRVIRPWVTFVIKNCPVVNLKMAACTLSRDGLHFENGRLHFQSGRLHFENGRLHFQSGRLHFQNGRLHFENGRLHFVKRWPAF